MAIDLSRRQFFSTLGAIAGLCVAGPAVAREMVLKQRQPGWSHIVYGQSIYLTDTDAIWYTQTRALAKSMQQTRDQRASDILKRAFEGPEGRCRAALWRIGQNINKPIFDMSGLGG